MNATNLQDVRDELLGGRNLFSVSEIFHENSRITEAAPGIAISTSSIAAAPNGFKRYVHAPTTFLPAPRFADASLAEVIVGRQSRRDYNCMTVSLQEMGTLAYAAVGRQESSQRRCVPSAGGLYPLELYVAAMKIDGLAPGLYHYDTRAHGLTRLRTTACHDELIRAIFIKDSVRTAAAMFALTGVFGRSKIKYGERAYRFVLLEAGHAMQNMCLAATGAGLGLCPIGGFVDDVVNDVLEIDGIEEAALYLATMGRL